MSVEIEARVLSAIIMVGIPSHQRVIEAMLILNKDLFYNQAAKLLFETISAQYSNGKLFDSDTLAAIVSTEVFLFLASTPEKSWSLAYLDADIKHLKNSHRRFLISQRLERLSKEFKAEGSPDDACEIASQACLEIGKLGVINESFVFTGEDNANNYLDPNKTKALIFPSNIETLDKLLVGGFRNKSLITIAGRPGMGKTGFGVHLAYKIASLHQKPHVLFYSLEMSANDIYEKQLSSILGKQVGESSKEEQFDAISRANLTPFTIHTKPLATIDYIEASARLTAVKSPFSVLVVDYLGIVQNTSKLESFILKQADISLRLAALAIELDCIVIALSQVNRDHAGRSDKTPVTTDAADSSGSERSSSYWFGIYRPNVDDASEPENDFIVKCRKDRYGTPGWTAYFAFNKATFGEVNQYIYTCKPMTPQKGIIHHQQKKEGKK